MDGIPVRMFATPVFLGPGRVPSSWPGVDRREAPGTAHPTDPGPGGVGSKSLFCKTFCHPAGAMG